MNWPWKRNKPDPTQYIADAIAAIEVTDPPGMTVAIASKPGCPKCSSVGVILVDSNLTLKESWGRCLRCNHFWPR